MVPFRYREGPPALSVRAQKAFQLANQEAHRLNHSAIGTEHLLIGLAKEALSPAAAALDATGFDLAWLREQVERRHPPEPPTAARPSVLPYTPELDTLLDDVLTASASSEVVPITPELLLLALLELAGGVAGEVLCKKRVARWRLRRRLRAGG